jgi:uncharacterized protein YkwD
MTTQADIVSAVQLLREGGCGGILPAALPLHTQASLDHAAELWAGGLSLAVAIEHSGYRSESTAALHINGAESDIVQSIRRTGCRTVMDRGMRDIGVYHRGLDTWLVLASAYVVPTHTQGTMLAGRVLELVNQARARGTRCGEHLLGPVGPVKLSEILAGVASGHASDMATHDYFEHEDLTGHSPAERVRAAGYREKLVGENIAYGPKSAEEVVRGWLNSSGHCENIMDSRFAEMGVAYAAGQASKPGLYWVQVLAAPRA